MVYSLSFWFLFVHPIVFVLVFSMWFLA